MTNFSKELSWFLTHKYQIESYTIIICPEKFIQTLDDLNLRFSDDLKELKVVTCEHE